MNVELYFKKSYKKMTYMTYILYWKLWLRLTLRVIFLNKKIKRKEFKQKIKTSDYRHRTSSYDCFTDFYQFEFKLQIGLQTSICGHAIPYTEYIWEKWYKIIYSYISINIYLFIYLVVKGCFNRHNFTLYSMIGL